jgi:hypothetical protein
MERRKQAATSPISECCVLSKQNLAGELTFPVFLSFLYCLAWSAVHLRQLLRLLCAAFYRNKILQAHCSFCLLLNSLDGAKNLKLHSSVYLRNKIVRMVVGFV